MTWLPIETAPKERRPFSMFVVIAMDFDLEKVGGKGRYTSDPWCVWVHSDGSFARWPHPFPPTHWCPLPPYSPHTMPQAVERNESTRPTPYEIVVGVKEMLPKGSSVAEQIAAADLIKSAVKKWWPN